MRLLLVFCFAWPIFLRSTVVVNAGINYGNGPATSTIASNSRAPGRPGIQYQDSFVPNPYEVPEVHNGPSRSDEGAPSSYQYHTHPALQVDCDVSCPRTADYFKNEGQFTHSIFADMITLVAGSNDYTAYVLQRAIYSSIHKDLIGYTDRNHAAFKLKLNQLKSLERSLENTSRFYKLCFVFEYWCLSLLSLGLSAFICYKCGTNLPTAIKHFFFSRLLKRFWANKEELKKRQE